MGRPPVVEADQVGAGRVPRHSAPAIACGMREYSYQATEATIAALRHLMRPWARMETTEHEVAITTTDDVAVVLSVERADIEALLEVSRLRADVAAGPDASLAGGRDVPVRDLGHGRNDVVLFSGESWMEEVATSAGADGADGAGGGQVMQFTGRAGQRPASATMVCTTTDAIVVAASTGEGVLIQIGVRPATLDVEQDRVAIARFLVQRGYASEEPDAS